MSETAIVPALVSGVVTQAQQRATSPPGGGVACPNLSAALAAARDRCKAASKDGKVAFGSTRYDYATSDQVIATACNALEGSGLAIIPVSEELTVVGADNRSFYALNRTLILSHCSGEFTTLEMRGWPVIEEKGRPLDKALAVALTTSLAYKLRDILQIPRGDQFGDDMNQRDDTGHVPQPLQAAVQRAQQKLDATPAERHPPVQFASDAPRQVQDPAKMLRDAGLPVTTGAQVGQPQERIALITEEQAKEIRLRLTGGWASEEDFLDGFHIDAIDNLQGNRFGDAIKVLDLVNEIEAVAQDKCCSLEDVLERDSVVAKCGQAPTLFYLTHQQLKWVRDGLAKLPAKEIPV